MIFVVSNVSGQKSAIIFAPEKTPYSFDPVFLSSLKLNASKRFKVTFISTGKTQPIKSAGIFTANSTPCQVISADFYTRNFGFFCKKELEFEKKTKIPLRFRLGSIRYVDHLEGKPNARLLTGQ